jgi:hypothetical protein
MRLKSWGFGRVRVISRESRHIGAKYITPLIGQKSLISAPINETLFLLTNHHDHSNASTALAEVLKFEAPCGQ